MRDSQGRRRTRDQFYDKKRLKYSIGSSKFAITKYTNSEHTDCIENKLYTSMRQILFIVFT